MDEDTGIAAVMGVLKHHVVELAEGARSLVHSRFAQGCEELTTDRQTDDSQLTEILDLKVRSLASTR
jgi:hypothetical protein